MYSTRVIHVVRSTPPGLRLQQVAVGVGGFSHSVFSIMDLKSAHDPNCGGENPLTAGKFKNMSTQEKIVFQ